MRTVRTSSLRALLALVVAALAIVTTTTSAAADPTPPPGTEVIWSVPLGLIKVATGPSGAVVDYSVSASDLLTG